nr:hypothetical protein Iba_chr13bCG1920 [Ipomoea batatas]
MWLQSGISFKFDNRATGNFHDLKMYYDKWDFIQIGCAQDSSQWRSRTLSLPPGTRPPNAEEAPSYGLPQGRRSFNKTPGTFGTASWMFATLSTFTPNSSILCLNLMFPTLGPENENTQTGSQVGRLWSSKEVLKSWMSANISRPVTVPLQAMVMSRRPSRIWKMGLPRRHRSTLEPCLHSGSARFLAENQRVPEGQPSHFCRESVPRNLLIFFQQGFDLLRPFRSHAAWWLGFSGAEICISVQERRSPP